VTRTVLALRSFGVAFGEQAVLDDVTFELPATGMTVLVGPAGCGKSTLVRTLAGFNDCHPSLTTWGQVIAAAPPSLVAQHARFFLDNVRENLVSALANRSSLDHRAQTEVVVGALERADLAELVPHLGVNAVDLPLGLQRRLALARALVADPAVLMVDEPTVGLDDHDATAVIATLLAQARERAVFMITHHQRYARAAGGTTILLADKRVREITSTARFFTCPETELGRQFLRTGGCTPVFGVPIDADEPRPSPPAIANQFVGPRGFFWVVPGRFGGMPRPGIVDRLDLDLDGLQRLGVTCIITLEEARSVDPHLLARAGIDSIHFPIVDMGAPPVDATLVLCRELARRAETGEVFAYHCRAGLGRTGTLLACQLVVAGRTARDALEAVRSINPRCVQSTEQVEFLRSFAAAHAALATRTDTAPSTKQETTWH
jgi:atypical dual specificity phosphatase